MSLQWVVWLSLEIAYTIALYERLDALLTFRRRPSWGSTGLVAGLLLSTGVLCPVG
jgi:hypothetical protein